MSNSTAYNYRTLYKKVKKVLIAGWVPLIQSSPGMGKSSLVAKIAKDFNLKMIDHRLSTSSPEDLTGLPYFTEDRKAQFFPFSDLFPLEGESLPVKGHDENGKEIYYDGWMLFLDEFLSASKAVQAAAFKLILDRQVGQYNLHPKVVIVAAGNLMTDRSMVTPLMTAMQSRLVHLELALDFDVWLQDVAFANDYSEHIIGFLNYKQNYLFDFRPDHNNKTFCCPRTWEIMNDLVKVGGVEDDDLALFSGTISPGVATEFITYVKNSADLVRAEDILKDPQGCKVPTNSQLIYATVSHMLSVFEEKYIEAFITYIGRLDFQYRVLFMRGVSVRFPNIGANEHFRRGATELAKYLRE